MSRSEYVTISRAELDQLTTAARAWADFNLEDDDADEACLADMEDIVKLCDLWKA